MIGFYLFFVCVVIILIAIVYTINNYDIKNVCQQLYLLRMKHTDLQKDVRRLELELTQIRKELNNLKSDGK